MQGYRTILFNLAMMAVGLLGWKVSPEITNHWLDVFFSVWGIGAILMRLITTTPIGAAVNTEIAALTERVHFLISRGPSAGDITDLLTAVHDLFGKLETSPQLSAESLEVVKRLETALDTLQTMAPAAAALAAQSLSPAASEPVATPAAVAAVPASGGDGAATVPAAWPPAPAQPSPLAAEVAEAARVLAPIIPVL